MKKFERLYALDKKGKIRFFEVEVDNINIEDKILIVSRTGLLTTQSPVVNTKEIKRGKQGRSSYEQAIFEAESMIDSKYNEGYKSFDNLNKVHTSAESFSETEGNVERLFKALNIQWNTSRNYTPLPMLANTYKKGKVRFPIYGQPKLDGVRCIAIKRNNKILLCSRGGKFYTMCHEIVEELKSIFEKYPNVILDGEIYKHGRPLNEISGQVRRESRDMFEKWDLEYHIYDVILDPNKLQWERIEDLWNLFNEFPSKNYIKFVNAVHIFQDSHIKGWHDDYVSDGYEGLILRDPNAKYMFGFRDSCLLKVKEFKEDEFVITGCEVNPSVGISSFVFTLETKEGNEFKCRAIGSHDIWQKYYNDINNIRGCIATVRYLSVEVNNVPVRAVVKTIRNYE